MMQIKMQLLFAAIIMFHVMKVAKTQHSPDRLSSIVGALNQTQVHCPDGWTQFYGDRRPEKKVACYMAQPTAATFETAALQCERLGGTLPSIHSVAEQNFLYSMAANAGFGSTYYWIGMVCTDATNVVTKANWKWLDGTAVDYAAWYSSYPTASSVTVASFYNHPQSGLLWTNGIYPFVPLRYICLKLV